MEKFGSKRFSKRIQDWYEENQRNLEWRKTKDPYKIWLSEVILQQTQVKQGLPYYLKFIKYFPTIKDLAEASEDDVLKLWQGLGYYSRARNLHNSAKYITYKLNGKFPNNYKDLLSLKGVGDYTASAISSFCFGELRAVVDGNVYRVLARYFGVEIPINSTQGIHYFKELATSLMNANQIANYNQAIMEFGSLQCKPKSPDCKICILNDSCISHKRNIVYRLPIKLKKTSIKKRYFNYIIFSDKNRNTIINQRNENDIWKKLYEFPLIEASCKISKNQILNDNFLSHMKISEIDLLTPYSVIHKLTHQHIYTQFWSIKIDGILELGIPFKKISEYAMPVLISNFFNQFHKKY